LVSASLPARDYEWLRGIHRYWILPLEIASTVLLIAIPVSAFVFWLAGLGDHSATAAALLAASFGIALVHHLAFYHLIRCPKCGHNPTKYKNGKKIPRNAAWKRLSNYDACPKCGPRHTRCPAPGARAKRIRRHWESIAAMAAGHNATLRLLCDRAASARKARHVRVSGSLNRFQTS
jgi:hypothetical protein